MPGATASELLTIAEAASLLRLKTSTMRAWILRRRLPYCKVGRLVRIRRTDVEALIAAALVPARPNDRESTYL
jgi:excisionase family DNA binding protein